MMEVQITRESSFQFCKSLTRLNTIAINFSHQHLQPGKGMTFEKGKPKIALQPVWNLKDLSYWTIGKRSKWRRMVSSECQRVNVYKIQLRKMKNLKNIREIFIRKLLRFSVFKDCALGFYRFGCVFA